MRYTKPAFEGEGDFVFVPYPERHAVRRARHQQAVAARERRPRHQDHLAFLGRGRPRNGPEARRAGRRNPGAQHGPRNHLGAGLRLPRHPGRRDRHAARLRAHRVRHLRARAGASNALDLLGPQGGEFVPYLSTRVRVRKTRDYKKLASIQGVPRQLGRGIAEAMPLAAAQKGLTRRAGVSRGRPREARDQYRARARGAPRLGRGAAPGDAVRRLREGASAVGDGHRPRQVHRVPCLRHGLLRGEQHPDGG